MDTAQEVQVILILQYNKKTAKKIKVPVSWATVTVRVRLQLKLQGVYQSVVNWDKTYVFEAVDSSLIPCLVKPKTRKIGNHGQWRI